MKRVLIFNFFGGVMDRGIPLYAHDIAECMRRVGLEPVELRCPRLLRSAPRYVRNALFVAFEQLVAPTLRILRRCSLTVYPYNSAGVLDALLGRSVVVMHDLIGNGRDNGTLAGKYIRYTQSVHRRLARPFCAASVNTLRHLRRLPAFRRCTLRLWSNPFYSFEGALARCEMHPARQQPERVRVLLCSGMGPNKDYDGALQLFRSSEMLRKAELRILGFGDDAHLAQYRVDKLPRAIRERVTVLPRLALSELVAEYTASDLVWVHSSKEGFGRCIVEAALAGRPVLASNISAFRSFHAQGVYIYRKGHFDAGVSRALIGRQAPSVNTSMYHPPLEAAVREVVASHGTKPTSNAMVSSDPKV